MHHARATRLLRTMICTLLLSVMSICLFCPFGHHAYGQALRSQETTNTTTFQLVVQASPHAAYRSESSFENKKLQRELEQLQAGASYTEPLPPDTTLIYHKKGQTQHYGVTENGELVDSMTKSIYAVSPGVQEALRTQVQALRAQHYGEILTWEDASAVIPKYSKFTITDVESGLSFEGQRRAGSSHADVQPLTKTDSATLKTIYGGAWSWDRKAVLVKFNGRTLAGSMHGMPHGGDGIPGNDFNGHFCIHFLGSVTHGSHSSDPAHQVMVHRAAGLLTSYISKLSPWALIDVWISGANQGDLQLLQVTTGQEQAMHVRSMRRLSKFPERDVSQLLELEAAVDVTVTPARASAPAHRRVLFRLERASLDSRWYIRSAVMQ
ncbi:hypothetical protein HZF08_06885 [Paenibacillus sp. CGMCC 1.16610]|uniref:Uncharacterized protein n=1 Tax=Paenibacillus anseongense TaxID=2682845 RepID=A0ABW9UCQ7_9BACL|nr:MULTISPECIES: hypothetical protein [Paenibacillus]MBA2938027.1 hypothetical protein [Paenibacillus sp. CGMCC 1.16610]MVQ37085.1 hypothetical protein [Paenibacillus anseongense]